MTGMTEQIKIITVLRIQFSVYLFNLFFIYLIVLMSIDTFSYDKNIIKSAM